MHGTLRICAAIIGCAAPLLAQPVLPTATGQGANRVLLHAADAFSKAPAWTLGPRLAATAGAAAPDLTHAQQVALLADGGFVVHSAIGRNFLHHFAANGQFVRSLARSGSGPGELIAPSGLAQLRGDTLVVIDGSPSRISWFTTRGFARSVAVPSSTHLELWMIGALRTGALVTRTAAFALPRMKVPSRPLSDVWVVTPKGTAMQRIGSLPDFDFDAYPSREKPGPVPQPVVFSRMGQVAAWDSLVVLGDGNGYALEVIGADGASRYHVRVPNTRRAVTTAMREAARAQLLAMAGGSGTEGGLGGMLGEQRRPLPPAADSLPPYDALLTALNGLLWVVDGRGPTDSNGGATAFRADGAIVGRFTWSGNRVPLAFGADRVAMRETDNDGVVSVVIYRLQRR